MSNQALLILIAVVVVIAAVIAFFVIRRRRYVGALTERGWSFVSAPTIEQVFDHQAPPFGLGFERKPDELVIGTTSAGLPFRVFEYQASGGGPSFNERLASIELPYPLPDAFLGSGTRRPGVLWPPVDAGGVEVCAGDPGYAAALAQRVVPAVSQFGQQTGRADLGIDGNHLVAVGAPKGPDELATYLETLAAVAQAIGGADLQGFATPARAPGVGFYGRPDWQLAGRDDSLIAKYGLTTAGFGHETERLIRARNDGLPLEAFVHNWKTQRTVTETDSEGRTRTRTVTDSHSEIVLGIVLPFSLPLLSVGGGGGGERVRFESEEFNDAFTVRTSDPKFASDVIHPRTMEYLMATRPPGFRIEGQFLRFYPNAHDTLLVGRCADTAHGFFARVPSFVWEDLGILPPAFQG